MSYPTLVWGPPAPPVVTPPVLVISGIVEDQLTDLSVRISWDTSEVSQGWLEWGTALGGPYPNETTHETSYIYSHHAQTISGLTPSTTYYYKVVAVDLSSNTVRSSEGTFTTSGDPNPPPGDITYTDYIIPPGIDHTGATDVTAVLQAFIDSVPSGSSPTGRSRIRAYTSTAIYQTTRGICLGGKSYLDLDGRGTGTNGATLQAHPSNYTYGGMSNGLNTSRILTGVLPMTTGVPVSTSTDIRIYGWQLIGNAATDGSTPAFQGEWQCGVFIGPTNGLEIYDCLTNRQRGDAYGFGGYGASDVHIHDVRNIRAERQFVSLDNCTNVMIEDFIAGIACYYCFDFEYGGAGGGREFTDITIRNGTFERWDGKTAASGGGFVAIANQSYTGNTLDNVVIDSVTVTGSHHAWLRTIIGDGAPMRLNDITVRNCSAVQTVPDFAIRARNVDGLTITGNHQPGALGPGSWWAPSNPISCTDVVGPPANGNTV